MQSFNEKRSFLVKLQTKNLQKCMTTTCKRSKAKIVTLVLFALVILTTFNGLRQSKYEVRRYLCTSRKFYMSSSSSSNDGPSFLTNIIDGLIINGQPSSRRGLSVDEECETVYPSDVSTARWTEYYGDEETGLYYEELAPVDILKLEGYNPDLAGGEVDPVILAPDYETSSDNVDEASLLGLFEPRVYSPVDETTRPANTTAYAVVIECCPEKYDTILKGTTDPGSDIFEASAMLKQGVCNATETAAIERRKRRREQELVSMEDIDKLDAYAFAMDPDSYTMYAFVHPTAVNCENNDGSMYNRVSLLQEQGYHVEIVGQPITDIDLEATQPYIAEHIQEDAGVRDSMALHAFNLEEHNGVVIMDYNTQLQKPIQDEVDSLMADPNLQVKYVRDKDGGISKNFMIIKPSTEVFQDLRRDYMSTPYIERRGWNGEGHNTFPGNLGLKGYFSYRAAHDPNWQELDRCRFNNQLDDECIDKLEVNDSTVIVHSKSVCGEPRTCPYDHPAWTEKKRCACEQAHSNYFRQRYDFEQKYFIKPKIQERIGRFKDSSYLGYCIGPGHNNYLSMTSRVLRKPDWQTVCPPMTCPGGTFLKPDCTCTFPDEDPCNACPDGTRCQRWPEPMCIDCNCGFCDSRGESCCQSDGFGSCRLDNMECAMQMDNFPAFLSTDNVCNGVETADTVLPYGCGCKLSSTLPCSYNPALQKEFDDRCYICSSRDLIDGKCPDCIECLKHCDSCIEAGSTSSFLDTFSSCLSTMDSSCRAQCNAACKKDPDHSALGMMIKVKTGSENDFEINIDEMLDQFGLDKKMLCASLPFLFLIIVGIFVGRCCCGGRK